MTGRLSRRPARRREDDAPPTVRPPACRRRRQPRSPLLPAVRRPVLPVREQLRRAVRYYQSRVDEPASHAVLLDDVHRRTPAQAGGRRPGRPGVRVRRRAVGPTRRRAGDGGRPGGARPRRRRTRTTHSRCSPGSPGTTCSRSSPTPSRRTPAPVRRRSARGRGASRRRSGRATPGRSRRNSARTTTGPRRRDRPGRRESRTSRPPGSRHRARRRRRAGRLRGASRRGRRADTARDEFSSSRYVRSARGRRTRRTAGPRGRPAGATTTAPLRSASTPAPARRRRRRPRRGRPTRRRRASRLPRCGRRACGRRRARPALSWRRRHRLDDGAVTARDRRPEGALGAVPVARPEPDAPCDRPGRVGVGLAESEDGLRGDDGGSRERQPRAAHATARGHAPARDGGRRRRRRPPPRGRPAPRRPTGRTCPRPSARSARGASDRSAGRPRRVPPRAGTPRAGSGCRPRTPCLVAAERYRPPPGPDRLRVALHEGVGVGDAPDSVGWSRVAHRPVRSVRPHAAPLPSAPRAASPAAPGGDTPYRSPVRRRDRR